MFQSSLLLHFLDLISLRSEGIFPLTQTLTQDHNLMLVVTSSLILEPLSQHNHIKKSSCKSFIEQTFGKFNKLPVCTEINN